MGPPAAPGATDNDYERTFREDVRPAINRFQPELILLSAGFDAHGGDPLGGVLLTDEGFANLTRQVCDMAATHAGSRVVSVLEGGYRAEALATSVCAHLAALMQAAG